VVPGLLDGGSNVVKLAGKWLKTDRNRFQAARGSADTPTPTLADGAADAARGAE
jgi:hypothetical protein